MRGVFVRLIGPPDLSYNDIDEWGEYNEKGKSGIRAYALERSGYWVVFKTGAPKAETGATADK